MALQRFFYLNILPYIFSDMAKNAIHILKNETVLNEFKENAKAHTKLFSLDTILPVYEDIYKSCSINV